MDHTPVAGKRYVRDVLFRSLLALLLLNFVAACDSGQKTPAATEEDAMGPLTLTSPAFRHGEPIPRKYTCDGEDVSPPLTWHGAPGNTVTFALVMDDPDAPIGTWDHWVIFDIPATATGLPEAVPPEPTLPDGSVQGTNSWGRIGYGGPCPPRGQHRYFFRLYALDTHVGLDSRTTKARLLSAIEGHVLAQAELMGVYRR